MTNLRFDPARLVLVPVADSINVAVMIPLVLFNQETFLRFTHWRYVHLIHAVQVHSKQDRVGNDAHSGKEEQEANYGEDLFKLCSPPVVNYPFLEPISLDWF